MIFKTEAVTFLKKSSQKTIIRLQAGRPESGPPRPKGRKSFLVSLFSKKEVLAAL
jgi:hypothetical protein